MRLKRSPRNDPRVRRLPRWAAYELDKASEVPPSPVRYAGLGDVTVQGQSGGGLGYHCRCGFSGQAGPAPVRLSDLVDATKHACT